MVLTEFSFFVFSALILSRLNLALRLIWQNITQFNIWSPGLSVKSFADWCSHGVFDTMLHALENKTRIFEFLVLSFIIVVVAIYLDERMNICSCFQPTPEKKPFKFGYRKNNGPAIWKLYYENALGTRQSPINILRQDAITCHCGPLRWERYAEIPQTMVMYNDGYSISLEGVWANQKPKLTGLPLNNKVYVFNRLYFHWGPTDTEGSEHTIDYERFPLEVHMIFLKEKYQSLMDAHHEQNPDGMVIVAFLFEITPVDNPGFLNTISDNLCKVRTPHSKCCIEPFSLHDIYPEFSHGYFKYEGSITQPPCSEVVTYIVQKETIAVSKRQMSRFRKLIAFDGHPMVNNSRPVQKLNCRPVYYFNV